jgi:predicted NACHT family NTPase
VRHLLTQKLAALANVDWTPEQFMRHLRDVDALIAKEQEDVFEFAHRSFQEYLAATEIKDDKRRESLLTEALQAPENLEWWADTMRLYAAQTDTSQIIAAALKQPTLETLLLAIDFWQTGLTLQDQTVKAALFAQLNQPLRS